MCVLFKGLLTGFLTLLHSSFWLFLTLATDGSSIYAWNFYYVLLSVLGVFPGTFFSNASVIVPFELSTYDFLTGNITNIHFNLLTALLSLGVRHSLVLHIYPWLLGLVQDRVTSCRSLLLLFTPSIRSRWPTRRYATKLLTGAF